MLLRNSGRFLNSLAFRLTLTYAFISTISLLAVLAVSYLALQSTLQSRLDEEMAGEIQEYGSLLQTQDLAVLRDVLAREAVSEGTDRIFFRVLNPAGDEVISTDMTAWDGVGVNKSSLLSAAGGKTVFETARYGTRPYPVRILYGRIGADLVMQMGESSSANAKTLQGFRKVFGLGILGCVCCSIAVGILMARRSLKGVRDVTRAAGRISSGDWDSRVPVSRRYDEIDELAASFNAMVEHVHALIRELKEVTDDIAHDLRTPITRMRVAAETALSNASKPRDEEQLAGNIVEECDRVLELINTMLDISQTEAGARPLARERIDLSSVVEDVYELFRPAAEDKGVALRLEQQRQMLVDGDTRRLKRAIAHIVDNAVKYTMPGGSVTVNCSGNADKADVSISDTGVGIPEEDLEKVFARFYRVDKSRAEAGNGLGLSLSRAILRAHGGDVTVTSVFGEGSTFTATVPAVNN